MKPLLVANWKQYLTVSESVALARSLKRSLRRAQQQVDVLICPSTLAWVPVHETFRGQVALGAQDVFWSDEGACTSALGPAQLRSVGCQSVIIGHSERRKKMRETSADVARKVKAAIGAGMRVMVCVGEVGVEELASSLEGVEHVEEGRLMVIFEPESAISGNGGAPASPEMVTKTVQTLRAWLDHRYPGQQIPVLYGGSVSAVDVLEYLAVPTVAGVFVGKMSTQNESFTALLDVIVNHVA